MAPAEHISCSSEEKAINIGVSFSISLNELPSDTSGYLDLERSYDFSRKSVNVRVLKIRETLLNVKTQKCLQKEGSHGPPLETTRLKQAWDTVLKYKEDDRACVQSKSARLLEPLLS